MDASVLARKQLAELKGIAASLDMKGYQRLKKAELVEAIVRTAGGKLPLDEMPDAAGTADGSDGRTARNGSARRTRAATGETDARTADTPEASAPADQKTDGADATESSGSPGGEGQDEGKDDGKDSSAAERARARTRVRTRVRERTAEGDDPEKVQASQRSAGDGRSRSRNRGQDVEGADGQPTPTAKSGEKAGGDQAARDDTRPSGRGDGQQADDRSGQGDGQGSGDDRSDSGSRQQGGPGQPQHGQHQQGQPSPPGQGKRSRRERRRKKGKGGGVDDSGPAGEPGELRVGVLDVLPEGYGFLRVGDYLPGEKDAYVAQGMVRKHGLRRGDVVEGPIRAQRQGDKVPALHHVQKVNGVAVDESTPPPHRPDFKDMTPLFPDERLPLETPDGPISMRIMDLMAPIGKGQRALIVSPPKAGKTTILKELGQAIAHNSPECHLMVVLVDERPEEVTDMERSIPGEVIASTFDRPADDHTQIAELAMERAKRLVEQGKDVVVLLDSITRLARAYNLAAPASGRIMSGGVDSSALYPPKRFFGAARNIEGGGSLTIIASALIETGSKMDEVIFEEFKGTGNCELRLDRRLEQKRIFPAIDIDASGTRKEELLLDREELQIIWKLRRVLAALDGPAALELLIDKMKATRSNNQFLVQIQKSNLQT